MYKHILVPLDGSLLAAQALPQLKLLYGEQTRITLLQVVRDAVPVSPSSMALPSSQINLDQLLDEAKAYLKSVDNKMAAEGVSVQRDVVMSDDVANSIVGYATNHGVDLIVMSTHGRGGLSRLVSGSVAERLLQIAPCPLLVVRPH